jgi:Sec-independent protein translocase protein TatA
MLGFGLEEIVVVVAVVLVFAVPGKMPTLAKNEVKQKPSLQTYLKTSRKKS